MDTAAATQANQFPTHYSAILSRIEAIDPVAYGKSRNFKNGSVTQLSPYISRGVISTSQILKHVLDRGYRPAQIEKFIQELAWRDYWQQVWLAKGDAIDQDLRHPQPRVSHFEMPRSLVAAETGINAVDQALTEFYQTGYLHNHMRMYIAAMACNVGQAHWRVPAQWMYYHLLDADWASNALSWQWVAGSNSNKKYFANQQNINKYFFTRQTHTFLDVEYAQFPEMEVPDELAETFLPDLQTPLPNFEPLQIDPEKPTFLYTFYNLDPNWHPEIAAANRILILEPSHFEKYPISQSSVDFMLDLGKNIPGLQVFVGEFSELISEYKLSGEIFFKEHPFNAHFKGTEENRDWMFGVKGYFSSFFGFWKKGKRELKSGKTN